MRHASNSASHEYSGTNDTGPGRAARHGCEITRIVEGLASKNEWLLKSNLCILRSLLREHLALPVGGFINESPRRGMEDQP